MQLVQSVKLVFEQERQFWPHLLHLEVEESKTKVSRHPVQEQSVQPMGQSLITPFTTVPVIPGPPLLPPFS
jgi:hypothetical protein